MPKSARPVATFDHLAKKKPLERRVRIVLEDAPLQRLEELREQAAEKELRGEQLNGLSEQLKDAEGHLDAASVWCVFRAIGRKGYDDLIRAHPATDCEKDCGECDTCNIRKESGDATARAPYHAETFAPALIAASCVEPQMSVEQVATLFDEWTTAEIMSLFVAALEVNTQRRVVDEGKGSRATLI